MKVILAETYGFCGGVNKAVNLVYSEAEKDDSSAITMEGPVIHNNSVITDLEDKGVTLVSNESTLEGKRVIIRAHGISPAREVEIKKSGGKVIDGTCPIVKSSQIKIDKYNKDGYFIVITGDKGHAEVIGLVGYAPSNSVVVANIDDLKNYTYPEKTLLISQTTFSKPEFFKIEEELKKICPTLETLCTICNATKLRQDAVKELSKIVDAIIVVGGKTSSNTKRLKNVAEKNVPAYLIKDKTEIPKEIIQYSVVGVTAGASTPDYIVKEVVTALESLSN